MLSVSHLWFIPLLPLIAAAIGALTPRRGRRTAAVAALGGMAGAFVLSCGALAAALRTPSAHGVFNFTWFEVGASSVQLGWLLDPLTAFMAVMVSFVGLLIFIFSLEYMRDDRNFARFFCFLSLFASAMLGLVVANSLLLFFVCWEVVGLASYLLIGFWFEKPAAAAAAKKAFITTRLGDLGLLLGIVWLYHTTGTQLLFDHGQGAMEPAALEALAARLTVGGLAVSTAIGLLLFCGAIGKSGQFPLHVWLPDAMEGPTPVSALIHAATMVAAGVFLLARVFPLLAADQAIDSLAVHALPVVATIGSVTALLGAVLAVAQDDIKRVLAYSTVSQLGYMTLAVGVGSWPAAIFHLLTHAFFKALLFLGSGSVIHATHHEQDIRRLGGLAGRMRATFATFTIGMMALAGVPFLFSGFWSKEGILHAAQSSTGSHLPLYAALIAAGFTAFYMTRLLAEVFLGRARSHGAESAHENNAVITAPLIVLALGAAVLGYLGTPLWPWLQATLQGKEPHGHPLFAGGMLVLSSTIALAGIAIGAAIYARRPRTSASAKDPLQAAMPRLHAALAARLRFDELYAATLGRAFHFVARASDFADRHLWGGAVRFLARLGELGGVASRENDEEVINSGFDRASGDLRQTGRAYSSIQTGDAHAYLRFVAIGFVLLVLIVMIGGAP